MLRGPGPHYPQTTEDVAVTGDNGKCRLCPEGSNCHQHCLEDQTRQAGRGSEPPVLSSAHQLAFSEGLPLQSLALGLFPPQPWSGGDNPPSGCHHPAGCRARRPRCSGSQLPGGQTSQPHLQARGTEDLDNWHIQERGRPAGCWLLVACLTPFSVSGDHLHFSACLHLKMAATSD